MRILWLLPAIALILPTTPAQRLLYTLAGDAQNAVHGLQLAVGGDFSSDGVRDLVVLELGDSSASSSTRRQNLRICSGVDGQEVRSIPGPGFHTYYSCMAATPDMNQDQIPDVAVGSGLGITVLSGVNLQSIRSFPVSQPRLLLSPGDVNADGTPDLVHLSGSVLSAINGLNGNHLWSVQNAITATLMGDTDADGVTDVAVLVNSPWTPSLALVSGRMGTVRWTVGVSASAISSSMAGLGDANIDGIPDLALGVPQVCSSQACQGFTHIISGLDGSILQTITKNWPEPLFGTSVADAGDFNGDGYGDYWASNPQIYSPGARGRLHAISGRNGVELGSIDGWWIGSPLAGGFDLDNDGVAEAAVASFDTQGSRTIKVYTQSRATYATFGSSCPGSRGLPVLRAVTLPRVGRRFDLQISNLAIFQLGFVYTGFSNQTWAAATQQLPYHLGALGLPACTLFISPDLEGTTHSGGGTAYWGFLVPDRPEFYGFEFFNQAFFFDPLAIGNVVVSEAGRGSIGL